MPATFSMTLNSEQISQLKFTYADSAGKEQTKTYSVFSGAGDDRNNPNSTDKADAGPLPTGKYYVVDRESGGRLGRLRDWWSDKDIWFALYRDDGNVNDSTIVNGVVRGQFRMHPGTISVGCVTFVKRSEFDEMRAILLKTKKEPIPGGKTEYYAILTVN